MRRGRPTIYETEEEKREAQRYNNMMNMRKKREEMKVVKNIERMNIKKRLDILKEIKINIKMDMVMPYIPSFSNISYDMILLFCGYLTVDDMMMLLCVNKHYKSLLDDDVLWLNLLKRDYKMTGN